MIETIFVSALSGEVQSENCVHRQPEARILPINHAALNALVGRVLTCRYRLKNGAGTKKACCSNRLA